MQVTFNLPDDMELVALQQLSRGWQAYLHPKRGPLGYLFGLVGSTPDEAVQATSRAIREKMANWKEQDTLVPQGLTLQLDLTRLRKS